MIKRIQQQDLMGCGIACAAMIRGFSYADTRDLFIRLGGDESRLTQRAGIDTCQMEELLLICGFALARKYRFNQFTNNERDAWPPEPFADLHLCQVRVGNRGHFVVMLKDGTVLDPAATGQKQLSSYEQVDFVAAVASIERGN